MATANDVLLDALERIAESVPAVLEGLSVMESRWRPDGGANSVAWLVWHATRQLDLQVAHAYDTEQVHTSDGWDDRIGVPFASDDIGYGHSPEQVSHLKVDDLTVLAGYHAAVHDAAVELIRATSPEALDEVVDDRWDPPVTRVVRLVSTIEDAAKHVGQAEFLRGVLLRRR